MKQRHMLAPAALAIALGFTLPAHAGLLGGSGSVGGGFTGGIGPVGGALNGSLHGQGAMQAPSPKPVVDKARDKGEAAAQTAADVGSEAAKFTGIVGCYKS